jgi:dTDP-D-glucose 4,6-dehydratase
MRGRWSRRELISVVADRPGNDARYAIDGGKLRDE